MLHKSGFSAVLHFNLCGFGFWFGLLFLLLMRTSISLLRRSVFGVLVMAAHYGSMKQCNCGIILGVFFHCFLSFGGWLVGWLDWIACFPLCKIGFNS